MKLYGILPYRLLEEPIVVAGVRFESHYKNKPAFDNDEGKRLLELNRMFVDELDRRGEISTWFVIDVDEGKPFDVAYSRLISALQFAILDAQGPREQPSSEVVDAWLFWEEAYLEEEDYFFWRSVSPFASPLHVSGKHNKITPRAPHIRFEFARGQTRVEETISALVTPSSLLELQDGASPLLDSLPFFIDSCRSEYTSDIRIRLVALTTAFEVLFEMSDAGRRKADELMNRVEEHLSECFVRWKPGDAPTMIRNLRKFVKDMYLARDRILHEGETDISKMAFLSKRSTAPFVGFLWKGRQIFVACVRAFLEELDEVELAIILRDLTSNEDRLNRILTGLQSGSADREREALSLCSELQKYPSPESNDLIVACWVKLVEYAQKYGVEISSTVSESAENTDMDPFALQRLFLKISEEYRDVDFLGSFHDEKMRISWDLSRFVDYAWYAVLLPHKIKRVES